MISSIQNFIANGGLMMKLAASGLMFGGFYLALRFFIKPFLNHVNRSYEDTEINFDPIQGPLRALIMPFVVLVTLPFLDVETYLNQAISHVMQIWLIISISWLSMRLFQVFKAAILSRYHMDAKDNLKARQISTQLMVMQRVLVIVVVVLAISIILLTFDKGREIGLSLLASAGIAGVIIGLAAQRSLATLFAGIQLAITQPIRIDDVVIIEKEWGRIEEITLTYAVVRIWDQRRLVVPLTYFIETPFQNWTRTTADMLGTVYLYVDYQMPIDALREELQNIVKGSDLWDQRVASIVVTNATERTVELRALISAENSSNAWDLRCLVREQLIKFLHAKYPDSLPRVRMESENSTSFADVD
ncbi:MAG: mechanosensitive ion channel family protein [Candidatus Marinimicrobia bacterium]|nr:mechanosensitive ion channel family protein [Candidatus Neomarinimicrobiota bacterium]MCF7922993.1 mechanosensitive ion channel family protein [Candidatus Neomarinimicrobiota bacterium]